MISINPIKVLPEDKDRLLRLCEVCPNININDNIGLASSTSAEYRNAELWIESVLSRNM